MAHSAAALQAAVGRGSRDSPPRLLGFQTLVAEPITGGNSGFIGFPSPPGILGVGPGFRQGEQLTLIVRGREIVKDAPR